MRKYRVVAAVLAVPLLMTVLLTGSVPGNTDGNTGGVSLANAASPYVNTSPVPGFSAEVIYENDFSDSSTLSDFRRYKKMKISGGRLYAYGSSTSSYAAYTIPSQYHDLDYVIEADYLGCSSMGGLLVGATGSALSQTPSYFSGYTGTTAETGDRASICFFSETGWGGGGCTSSSTLPTNDLHLWMYVQREELTMTFRVYSLDGTQLYQGFRYEIGDVAADTLYDSFTDEVGIRQYTNDSGRFDNFKVTVLRDDVLPAMNSSVSIGGVPFVSSGLTVSGDCISGVGAAMSSSQMTGDRRISLQLASRNVSRIYFGMQDNSNGYALEINALRKLLIMYRINDGDYEWLAQRSTPIREGYTDLSLEIKGGVVTVWYDNYYAGDQALPYFEFALDNTNGKTGFWLENGEISSASFGSASSQTPATTYINPVNQGADPDILFYNGTYYLYVYSGNDGTNIFRVYTSPDLVHFTERNYIFEWKHTVYLNVQGGTSWSPNVFYNEPDGLFYLTFAAKPAGSDQRRVYYAVSDSPFGPFTHDGELDPINDVNEIDGHVFVGYDGKTYMSFSRYDYGGTIWLEEVEILNGKITAKTETATRVIVPDMEWENDGATRLVEGGFVWKHGGYYYMVYATVSYARHYGEAVAVATNPLGPYEKCEYNPILKHNFLLDGPGDSLIIPSPDGSEVYMVYHRHCEIGNGGARRETCIDLVRFVPDPDGGPDILTLRAPTTTPQSAPSDVYRYDPDRDGMPGAGDARKLFAYLESDDDYSGKFDADSNGSVSIADAIEIMKKAKEGN